MAILSPARASVPIIGGLELLHRGKVRDSYKLVNKRRLPFVTDGISIYDFVLNALVPDKGAILNAMSHYWFAFLESRGIKTHMIAAGSGIDAYLPEFMHGDTHLQSHAMVVRDLNIVRKEFIARNCLTGSVLKEYRKSGTVYGHPLPAGLQDGDRLEPPLFTPTTKAEEGHDEPIDEEEVRREHPKATQSFLRAITEASAEAWDKGIMLADSKGELDDEGCVGDEFGTPDSSRFWDREVWIKSRESSIRKAPPPFDKELVRIWGQEQGIDNRDRFDPKNPEHVKRVQDLEVPRELIEGTSATYHEIFRRLTDHPLREYQRERMRIAV